MDLCQVEEAGIEFEGLWAEVSQGVVVNKGHGGPFWIVVNKDDYFGGWISGVIPASLRWRSL